MAPDAEIGGIRRLDMVDYSRDIIGYGGKPPHANWLNMGAHIYGQVGVARQIRHDHPDQHSSFRVAAFFSNIVWSDIWLSIKTCKGQENTANHMVLGGEIIIVVTYLKAVWYTRLNHWSGKSLPEV